MGMRVKDNSVEMSALQPAMYWALRVAEDVYVRHGVEDMVITSARDGHHSLTSLHEAGAAVDLRTRNIPAANDEARAATARTIAESISHRLGIDFDVIFEGDHIHLELQPRRR